MTFINCHSQALVNAVRELLDKSRSEKVSTKAPIEFAENPQLPETATTSGAASESQSCSKMEFGSNMVGENVNDSEDVRQGVRVEKMGQDLEDCNLEFLIIEKQI